MEECALRVNENPFYTTAYTLRRYKYLMPLTIAVQSLKYILLGHHTLFLPRCSYTWLNNWHATVTTAYEFWSLWWRHNELDGVSDHQPHGCLLNRLFRRRSQKTSKLRVTGLCVGNSPGPVNSQHKGPVTRKMFSFYDVIMFKGKIGSTLSLW